MKKAINFDRLNQFREELSNLNSMIEDEKQSYEQRTKTIDEQYQRLKDMEKSLHEKKLKEIKDCKEDLLTEPYLTESYYISVGDLKREIMSYFNLKEDEVRVTVKPFDVKEGHYNDDKRISMVKDSDEYESRVYVEIITKDIYYRFMYKMNYNMLQADSISFIDHCYPYNDYHCNWATDELDPVSVFYVKEDSIDNILIKIPNLALIYESNVDFDGALIVDSRKNEFYHEYYFNSPIIPFRECIINCINKDKQITLTRTINE